jgi:predicted dehydrogenase
MIPLADATIIDPASVPALRWGVLSPGGIAETFVSSVHAHTAQRIVAVSSRTPGKAEDFATRHGIPSVEPRFEDLVARDDVDVVYIASYPGDHKEHALLAIAAGKHVLVEKPLTLCAADAREVLSAGKARGVLVMEAMWTRYLPQSTIIRSMLQEGALGAPQLFLAQFCSDNSAVERLWAPGGGGATFDMGIYTVAMAQQFLGNPLTVSASGRVHPGGADEEALVHLTYASGARANLMISGVAAGRHTASCSFENTLIAIDPPFLVPSGLWTMSKDFYPTSAHWQDSTGITGHDGLSYQATWLAHFVSQGLLESPVHTHEDTIAILDVCEEIVRQVTAR